MFNILLFVSSMVHLLLVGSEVLIPSPYTISSIEGISWSSLSVSRINNNGEICGQYYFDNGSNQSIDKFQYFVFIWDKHSGLKSIEVPCAEMVRNAIPEVKDFQKVTLNVNIDNIIISNNGDVGFNLSILVSANENGKNLNKSIPDSLQLWDGFNRLIDVGGMCNFNGIKMIDMNDNNQLLISNTANSEYFIFDLKSKYISNITNIKPVRINNSGEILGTLYSNVNMTPNVSCAVILRPDGELIKFPLEKFATTPLTFNDVGQALVSTYGNGWSNMYMWNIKNKSCILIKSNKFTTGQFIRKGAFKNIMIPARMNNSGEVIGTIDSQPAVLKNGKICLLNTALNLYEDPFTNWSIINYIIDINDLGQLLGIGTNNHVEQPVILTSVENH